MIPFLVILMMMIGGAFASAPDFVDDDRPELFIVGEGGFDNVNMAIKAAKDGDIIWIGPGVVSESIDINKRVKLVSSPQTIYTSTMIVSVNNAPELNGHTFIGCWDNVTSEGWDAAGIITRQNYGTNSNTYLTGLKVKNCIFRDCRQGIFLFGAKNAVIDGCSFYGCYRGITVRGHFIGNTETWTSYSNTIKNCNFYNMFSSSMDDGEAITIFNSNSNSISNCVMKGNNYGVYILGGTNNVVSGCTVTDSTYYPMMFENIISGRVTVTGNTIANNGRNVKFSNCTQFTFSNNIIKNNSEDWPVHLYNCNGFTFASNTINGSSVHLDRSTLGNFAGNTFVTTGKQTFTFAGSKGNYGHIIAQSNTVGGNPIRYYYDTSGVTIQDAVAGSVMLMYSPNADLDNVTVEGGDGIWLYNSGGYSVNANVTDCLMGINIEASSNGVLTSCTVDPSTRGWQGVRLYNTAGSVSGDCDIQAGNGLAWMVHGDSAHDSYNDVFPLNSIDVETAGGGHLRIHNALTVKVWQNESLGPYEGAEVNVTEDDVPVYQTPHYGGSMATTDSAGNIHVTLLDREYDHDNDAIQHDHNVSVYASIDAVWTDRTNYINMGRKVLLEFVMDDITAPGTPANLEATTIPEDDAIEVTWDANVDDTQLYSLMWDQGAGDWVLLGDLTTTLHAIDTGLVHGTEYSFKVAAWDEVPLMSPMTAVVSVIHVDGKSPLAPTGFQAFSVAGDSITLEWNANEDVDLEGYHLYIGNDWAGPWTQLSPVAGLTTTTFDVTDLDSETFYYFVLTAFDEVPNESPYSQVLEVMTLDVTAPDAPVLGTLPELTNEAVHALTGTAEAGSMITIFVNDEDMHIGHSLAHRSRPPVKFLGLQVGDPLALS